MILPHFSIQRVFFDKTNILCRRGMVKCVRTEGRCRRLCPDLSSPYVLFFIGILIILSLGHHLTPWPTDIRGNLDEFSQYAWCKGRHNTDANHGYSDRYLVS
jgi:hypothetical protein